MTDVFMSRGAVHPGVNKMIYKAVISTIAAALSVSLAASPALAQQEGNQEGLVNVAISDAVDVNNNTIQVPIGIAAQVCPDIDAAVIAEQRATTDIACTITQQQATEAGIGSGPGKGKSK